MIKTIQLLRESYSAYKLNFTNMFAMALPVLILILLLGAADYAATGIAQIFVTLFSIVVFSFAVSLFFQPAFYRSIQKLEDTSTFNKSEAYSLQKKNIWNYIVLNFWMIVYSIKINLKYIGIVLAAVFLYGFGTAVLPSGVSMGVGALAAVVIVVTLVASIIKNSPKVFLYQNIYFSKDITPRNAARESLAIGEAKSGQVWRIIFSSILLGLALGVLYLIVYGVVMLSGIFTFSDLLEMSKEGYVETNYVLIVLQLIGALFSYLVATPMTFMILAKGYNKIKDQPVVGIE